MTNETFSKEMSTGFLFSFILLAGVVSIAGRLFPHLPNFTPVGAFALFVGVYLARKHRWGLLLPLSIMFLSDIFIGFYNWKLMAAVYFSFFAHGVIGIIVAKKKNAATIILGSVAGGLFFYLTANFAVWAFTSWYPHTFEGLILSYAMALPFFRYTLLGNIVFTGIFFGAYEFARIILLNRKTISVKFLHYFISHQSIRKMNEFIKNPLKYE